MYEQQAHSLRSASQLRIRSKRFITVLIVIAAIGLILYGLQGLMVRQEKVSGPEPNLPQVSEVNTAVIDEPSERHVDINATYEVPADQPRRIVLPSIDSQGFIEKIGTTEANQIAVPSNINYAGWYTDRARPGDPGVSLIDGHLSGRYAPGIFKELKSLSVGDTYSVEFGDYTKRTFKVVSVNSYDLTEIDRHILAPKPEITEQLNLVTCGGAFDEDTQQYAERVLVVSERVRS